MSMTSERAFAPRNAVQPSKLLEAFSRSSALFGAKLVLVEKETSFCWKTVSSESVAQKSESQTQQEVEETKKEKSRD